METSYIIAIIVGVVMLCLMREARSAVMRYQRELMRKRSRMIARDID